MVTQPCDFYGGPLNPVVKSVTGTAPITVDSTDGENPIVGFDVTKLHRKNLINNGCFRVNQRAFTNGSAIVSGQNVLDRWTISFTSGAFNGIGNTIVDNLNVFGASVVTPPTLTTNKYFQMGGPGIEHNDANILAREESATLSFKIKSSVAGIYCVRVNINTESDGTWRYLAEFTVDQADTMESKVIVIPLDPNKIDPTRVATDRAVSINFCGISGPDYHGEPNVWGNVTLVSTPNCVNWAATAGNSCQIAEVQLEAGGQATEFERRDILHEYLMCQRYWYRYRTVRYHMISTGRAASGSTIVQGEYKDHPVRMRATPTITFNGALVSYQNTSTFGLVSGQAAASNGGNEDRWQIAVNGQTGVASANTMYWDATVWIEFNAEI